MVAPAEGYQVDKILVWKDRCHWEPGLYIPLNIRLQVTRHFHNDPEACHLGAEEMFWDIGKDFVWTGLRAVSYTHLDVYKRQILLYVIYQ